VIRLVLDPVVGPHAFFIFMLAVMAAARFGGRGPGLLATVLSVPAASYFFIEPRFTVGLPNPTTVGSIVALAVSGIAISLVIGRIPVSAHGARERESNVPFLPRVLLLGSAVVVLAVLTALLYSDFERENAGKQWVAHSYQVLESIQTLMSSLKDAEIAQRGYLLTGDESYREPLESALREDLSARQALRKLTAGNPDQQARLDRVERLVEADLSELQKIVALRRTQGMDVALAIVRAGAGRKLTDECRIVLRAMEEEDRLQLTTQMGAAGNQGTRMRWILGLGSGSLLMLLVVAGTVIERDIRSLERGRRAVHQSEERLRMALEAANAGTWEWDPKTTETVWSEELWELFGIERRGRAPSYDAWREAVHPDDRANVEAALARMAGSATDLNLEYKTRGGNGIERWLLTRGRQLRDGEGRTGRFVGIVLDITERKRAEEALRQAHERVRSFIDSNIVGVVIASSSGCIIEANDYYLHLIGYTREEFDQGRVDWRAITPPEWIPADEHALEELRQRGKCTPYEKEYVRRDGERVAVFVSDAMLPGPGEQIAAFVLDITGRKRADRASRENEARLRLAVAASNIGLWDWDLATNEVYFSPEWKSQIGYADNEISNRFEEWQSRVHPEDLEPALAKVRASIASPRGRYEVEFRFRHKDGSYRRIYAQAEVLRDIAGTPVRMLGCHVDITALRLAEEKLRNAEIQATLVLANMSDPFVSWDREWRYTYGNAAAEREMGYLCEDLIGRDVRPLFHPDPADPLRLLYERAMAENVPVSYEEFYPQRSCWVEMKAYPLTNGGLSVFFRNVSERVQQQNALRESEARLNEAQRNARIGSWRYLPSGTSTWSDQMYELFKLPRDVPVTDEAVVSVIHPDDRTDKYRSAFERALASGAKDFENEYRVVWPDGDVRTMFSLGKIRRDADGRVIEAVGTVQDITERKQAEQALWASEASYRDLFDNMLNCLCSVRLIFDGDRVVDFEYLAVNRAFAARPGMPDIVGKRVTELSPNILQTDPEWFELLGRVARDGVPESRELWLEAGREWYSAAVYNQGPDQVVFVFDIITPRKHAEDAVLRQSERLRNLHEIDRAILKAADSPDTIAQAATQRLCGLLQGQRAGVFISDTETRELLVFVSDANGGSVQTGKLPIEDADGSLEHLQLDCIEIREDMSATTAPSIAARTLQVQGVLSCISMPLFTKRGLVGALSIGWEKPRTITPEETEIVGEVASQIAIAIEQARLLQETQRHAAELEQSVRRRTVQLATANKELEAFSYSVSHDLRAPLRGIDGWSLALAEDYGGQLDERAHQYIDRVRAETQRMGLLIDDLLQLSRVSRAEMQFVPVDLSATARVIAAALAEANPTRQIEFVIQPDLCTIGDARLLEIALTNLLSNAAKFTGTRAQARIEFGQENQQNRPVFYVRDNGVGFDMTYAASLFRAFRRLHKTSEFPGTGVGLSTVQRVIHRHSGRVWAEAERDRGATFYFTSGETS
jgi:PAS domain S-box-containing protein